MSAVARRAGGVSLATTLPPHSCFIGPFGTLGRRDTGAGERLTSGDLCFIHSGGDILRAVEDQTGTTAAVNDVQTMYSTAPAASLSNITGGSFTVGYQGQYTPPQAVAAGGTSVSSATLQTAVRALSTINGANITIGGAFPNYTFTGAGTNAGKALELFDIDSSVITSDPTPIALQIAHTTFGQPIGASGAEQAQSRVRGMFLLPQGLPGKTVTLFHSVAVNYSDGLLTPGADYFLSGTAPGGLDTALTLALGVQNPVAFAQDTQLLYVLPLR